MTDNEKVVAEAIGRSVTFTKTVSESDVYLYAGITGDFSPNHVNAAYMSASRYGQRIAHGTLLLGFMSAASVLIDLGRTVSAGYDGVRFVAAVLFGDTITTEYKVTGYNPAKNRIIAEVRCRNQRDEVVAVATNLRAFVD